MSTGLLIAITVILSGSIICLLTGFSIVTGNLKREIKGKEDRPRWNPDRRRLYWSEVSGRIETANYVCVYNVGDKDRRDAEVDRHNAEIDKENESYAEEERKFDEDWNRAQAQLKCSAKGHKMEYDRPEHIHALESIENMRQAVSEASVYGSSCLFSKNTKAYIFKCKNCGIEITKEKSELTAKEKEALKLLKIL